jgi:LmbE family N-acetylglucosaminyl deacetylase|tara:strand:+ start:1028 stop:1858 length:831 start_codon:yes stop_codon:yes gene_type:complete
MSAPPRILLLGAHPDDAEYHAGGLLTRYRKELNATVKLISLTDGTAGHHERSAEELKELRQKESANAGKVIGAEYVNWDLPDAHLEATIENRDRVIREIRSFRPDLVLTHRPCDYHPDHRAVGQLTQDASYLVTVPKVLPEVPPLFDDPVILYMPDLFTRPSPLRPDLVLDVGEQVDSIIDMLACHRTQVFEWLPYEEGILDQVPDEETAKLGWLLGWFLDQTGERADRFRDALVATYGEERGQAVTYCEAYEVSEYASPMDDEKRAKLWPFSESA